MLSQARTLAYGCLAVTLDLLARPLFALIHRPPGGKRWQPSTRPTSREPSG